MDDASRPRRFRPYDEIARRKAVVDLYLEGWSVRAIAGYLVVSRPTSTRSSTKLAWLGRSPPGAAPSVADYRYAKAAGWAALQAVHDRFFRDHNHQPHVAHGDHPKWRRSPVTVLVQLPLT